MKLKDIGNKIMTQFSKFSNTNKKGKSKKCINCFYCWDDMYFLECTNESSDHYSHTFSTQHPACSYYEKRSKKFKK